MIENELCARPATKYELCARPATLRESSWAVWIDLNESVIFVYQGPSIDKIAHWFRSRNFT